MKFLKIFIIFALISMPVFASERTQSHVINEVLGIQHTDKTEIPQRDIKESNTRPLWSAEQIDAMAKEQAEKHPILNGPDIIYVVPLGL